MLDLTKGPTHCQRSRCRYRTLAAGVALTFAGQCVAMLAGLVSMLPAVDNRIFRIREGNARLPERLLEASGAKMKSDWVVDTIRAAKHGRFELHASHRTPPPGGQGHHHHHKHGNHHHEHKHGHHHHKRHGRSLTEDGEQERDDALELGMSAAAVADVEYDSADDSEQDDEAVSWDQVRVCLSQALLQPVLLPCGVCSLISYGHTRDVLRRSDVFVLDCFRKLPTP